MYQGAPLPKTLYSQNQSPCRSKSPDLGPTQRLVQQLPDFLEGGKAAGARSYSPPTSAEVKNEWSSNSNPPLYLHGVDRK